MIRYSLFSAITCCILAFNNCIGQSKSETQEWIRMQIERNMRVGTAEVKFYNNNFCWIHKSDLLEKGLNHCIPLKEVSEVHYTINTEYSYVAINFKLKDNTNQRITMGSEMVNGIITDAVRSRSTFIQLKKEIETQNLPNRLIKAFKHLIMLSGGKVQSENTF